MEVGPKAIDDAKAIAWRNEDVGWARLRAHAAIFIGGGLKRAQRRGADGDDAPALGLGAVDRSGRLLGDFTPLGMHDVRIGIFGFHRQEGSRADMQRHLHALHPHLVQAREQFLREMKSSRRRRHRAIARGVDGLVIAHVRFIRRALAGDVGRQRHRTGGGDGGIEGRTAQVESQCDLAGIAFALHDRIQDAEQAGPIVARAEADMITLPQALPRLGERDPMRRRNALDQSRLHRDA